MRRTENPWIRLTSAALLVWFGLLAVAPWLGLFSSPAGAFTADHRGGRFPCEDHRCGCDGAADCWEVCCCFSPLEMAAWASKAGVALPPGMQEYASLAAAPPASSCCATTRTTDEAAAPAEVSTAVTGAAASAATPAPAPGGSCTVRSPSFGTPGDAFSCRGVELGLLFAVPVTLAGEAVRNGVVPVFVSRVVARGHDPGASPVLELPDPPPRFPLRFCA